METFPQGSTRDIVASKLGIGSGKQYEKEKYIVENKDSLSPEDFANWDEGKLSTNKVYRQLKLGKSNPSQKSDKGKRTDDIVSEKLGIGSRDT